MKLSKEKQTAISKDKCIEMVEKHQWNNQTIDAEAQDHIATLLELEKKRERLNELIEMERVALRRLSLKMRENLEEQLRWKRAMKEIYNYEEEAA